MQDVRIDEVAPDGSLIDAATSRNSRISQASDTWIALTGLIAALAVLPLPSQAHSPEIASVLVVGAIALMTGHRWAVGVVVIADILLVAAVWPQAFLHEPPSLAARVAVGIACAGALPGMLSLGRAVPSLLELIGVRGSDRVRRFAGFALAAVSIALIASPIL